MAHTGSSTKRWWQWWKRGAPTPGDEDPTTESPTTDGPDSDAEADPPARPDSDEPQHNDGPIRIPAIESEEFVHDPLFDDEDTESEPTLVATRFVEAIHEATATDPTGHTRPRLITITVIGRLPDNSWAWTGEEQSWGTLTAETLATWDIQVDEGMRIRALVESYPWSHIVYELIRSTAIRRGETRRLILPAQNSEFSGWQRSLVPGDLVIANVPFSPHSFPDTRGRLSKARPAIFIGWSGQSALVRGIFTATGDRYISRNGVIRLQPESDLDHRVIGVKDRNTEIAPERISQRIGRLGTVNCGRIGLNPQPRSAPDGDRPKRSKRAISEPSLDTELSAYALELSTTITGTSTWSEVIDSTLGAIREGRIRQREVDGEGLLLADIGNLFATIESRHPYLGPRPTPLTVALLERLGHSSAGEELVLVQSHHKQPLPALVRAGREGWAPWGQQPDD